MGWDLTKETILKADRLSHSNHARFLFIFVPSKPEVYLPFVERNDDLLLEMAFNSMTRPTDMTGSGFFETALENRGSLEDLLEEFCATNGIPFFSFTAVLTEQIARGEAGYAPADSHWIPQDQIRGAEAIASWLDEDSARR